MTGYFADDEDEAQKKIETQSTSNGELKIDYEWLLYVAKTRLNFTEEEFWGSTLRRINRLHRYWLKENGMLVESKHSINQSQETLEKWGRPVTYSTDF